MLPGDGRHTPYKPFHVNETLRPMKDKKRRFKPESLMMSYGYNPAWSEGAIKCPIFQTSTFVFESAEDGKAFFEVAYGKRDQEPNEKLGLIYSRLNNPDLEILENRLCLWDGADQAAVFESGMSAISTVFLEFLRPGDLLVHSSPVYGGTDHLIHHLLRDFGIDSIGFSTQDTEKDLIQAIQATGKADRLKLIYVETPANPTNALFDLEMARRVADHFSTPDRQVVLTVDNTYMGPLWQHPLKLGADLVLYSATKYIAGHSDLIAGAVLGKAQYMERIRALRTFLGNMAGPWTGWLMMRSLETLKIRMERQGQNAQIIADYLNQHPAVEKVYYPGLLDETTPRQRDIFERHCEGPGAMISFDIKGGEKEAFAFLNHLELIKLAVSLGSTESLAEHPATMTHAGVDEADRIRHGITDKLIRLSIGVEDPHDLISDISRALAKASESYVLEASGS